MIFKHKDKIIIFTEEVVSVFRKYRQIKKNQHESGGILLGKVYNDSIIIDQVSQPSKEDKSGKYYFYRNVIKAQQIVNQSWKESNGERVYLGEWHTHPEDTPIPSFDDKKLLQNMLENSRMEIDFLFMVIIGRINNHLSILDKTMKTMISLDKVNIEDALNIIIYKNKNGQTYGFQASGYLNFAPAGYDIYNAAFSQIFFGTINSLSQITNLENFVFEQGSAFIRYIVFDIHREDYKINTLFNAMEIQIIMLIEEMRSKGLEKNIYIRIKETV